MFECFLSEKSIVNLQNHFDSNFHFELVFAEFQHVENSKLFGIVHFTSTAMKFMLRNDMRNILSKVKLY